MYTSLHLSISFSFFLFRENATPEEIMTKLIRVAQEKGVTDDVANLHIIHACDTQYYDACDAEGRHHHA